MPFRSAHRGTRLPGEVRRQHLQSFCGLHSQPARDSGDDQVGALHLCASICPVRCDAGRRRPSDTASAIVDHCCHGCGALGRHGIQPPGRRHNRRQQPAHCGPCSPCRPADARIRHHVYRLLMRAICFRSFPAESHRATSLAARIGGAPAVLVHQALYPLVAFSSRICFRNGPGSRLDRNPRLARSAHSASNRSRDLLGRRLRRTLRLPKFATSTAAACTPSRATAESVYLCGLRALFT